MQELSTAGVVQRNYIHGTEEDDPLVWYEYTGGTVRRFLHADHQGSIVAVADDAGNALAIDKYDEWGVPAAANLGRFQYTGQVWLPDLGLYYYKARIYSSRLGRFLQTDPVGYDDDVNLYAYVENDPVDRRDPTGNSWADVGNIVLGTAEVITSGAGIVVGAAGVVTSGVTETGTVGLSTPVSVPLGVGSVALVGGLLL